MPFMDNMNNAAGLLSSGNPMLDIGLGLLAQSGPVVGAPAPSLGQAFGNASQFASQREQGRLQTQAYRDKLQQDKDRREAMSQLQGLLGSTTEFLTPANNNMLSPTGEPVGRNVSQVPVAQTPEGRQQMLGLLGQVAPEAMAQGLLGQMFPTNTGPRLSTQLQDLQHLYPNASLEELQQMYQNMQGDDIDDLLKRLQVEEIISDRDSEAEDEAEQENLASTSFDAFGDVVSTIAESNAALAGTFLEPGRVGTQGGVRQTIASLTDEFSGNRNNLNTQLDNFESASAALINLLSEGAGTDAARRLIELEKPSAANTPESNARSLLRIIDEVRSEHQAQGTEMNPETIEALDSLIPVLEAQAEGNWERDNQVRATVEDIQGYSAEQVQNLFQNAEDLSIRQLRALGQRAEALGL